MLNFHMIMAFHKKISKLIEFNQTIIEIEEENEKLDNLIS
jgi:hypothetical protein